MSHQTGITASDSLLDYFGNCKCGHIRILKVAIENEQLVPQGWEEVVGDWEKDFDSIQHFLVEQQPTYILYRLDSLSHGGYEWLLISWSPDDSPVRQKMLYASTKATLKREFGTAHISQELFATSKEDASFLGYKKQKESRLSPAPLTAREEEINELKKLEADTDIGVDTRHQTLAGIAFPMVKEAVIAVLHFIDAKSQYVRLLIDTEKEEIVLGKSLNCLAVECLPKEISERDAQYHLYRFDHNYEGDYYHSVVFIYSMPGYSCPIKHRMLYSSCKNPLTDHLENVLNLNITKKLEISEVSELAVSSLLDEIHPKTNLYRPKFDKPKGPTGRGAKRLTKSPDELVN